METNQAKDAAPEAVDQEFEISIQDDTPEEDRNRDPLPQEIVKELEADELEDYSEKVKVRLKQMKKVWHDERRAKEAADRERQEAISLAQRLVEENKKLKQTNSGAQTALIASFKQSAMRGLKEAQTEYKEAFESGDSEKLLQAQQKLTAAQFRVSQAERYKTTPLQNQNVSVNTEQKQEPKPVVKPDTKAVAWQERNPWFGKNRQMTAMALGLHEDLVEKHGQNYASTEEYYEQIDKTIRSKFPEEFPDSTPTGNNKPSRSANKPASVVAPVSRTTSSKKIVLTESQVRLAKKLGITPEQYAREFMKQESFNG